MESFRHKNMEFLGQISAFTVPWAFLEPCQYNENSDRRPDHALKDATRASILGETARLPNGYLLGHTFGIDPSLWQRSTNRPVPHSTPSLCRSTSTCWVSNRRASTSPTARTSTSAFKANATLSDTTSSRVAFSRCLSVRVNRDDDASSVDIDTEARWVLNEAGIPQNYPVDLQVFRAN